MANLYRHFDAKGTLLYVGVSINALVRLGRHRDSEWFSEIVRVEIEKFPTREDALTAELAAIRAEKPRYNVVGQITERDEDQKVRAAVALLRRQMPRNQMVLGVCGWVESRLIEAATRAVIEAPKRSRAEYMRAYRRRRFKGTRPSGDFE